jgi:hypothetical protein
MLKNIYIVPSLSVFFVSHAHGMHHSQRDKKLRFYHVNDVRTLLNNAGYNKNTVQK